jgi:hypothetical protein
LAACQAHVGIGQQADEVAVDVGGQAGERRHDPVADAEQPVAGVDRQRDAALDMDRRATVTHRVVVLDVVVDERCLVKDLDRHRSRMDRRPVEIADRFTTLPAVADHRIERRQRHEWPQELPPAGEEIARHCRGGIDRDDVGPLTAGGWRDGGSQAGAEAELLVDPRQPLRGEQAGRLAEKRQVIPHRRYRTTADTEKPEDPCRIERRCGGDLLAAQATHGRCRRCIRVERHRGDRQGEGGEHRERLLEV